MLILTVPGTPQVLKRGQRAEGQILVGGEGYVQWKGAGEGASKRSVSDKVPEAGKEGEGLGQGGDPVLHRADPVSCKLIHRVVCF